MNLLATVRSIENPIRAVLTYFVCPRDYQNEFRARFVLQTDAADIEIEGQDSDEQPRQDQLYLRVLMDLFFGRVG